MDTSGSARTSTAGCIDDADSASADVVSKLSWDAWVTALVGRTGLSSDAAAAGKVRALLRHFCFRTTFAAFRLAGATAYAPITAFTGLPATPPLVGLAHQDIVQDLSIDWVKSEAIRHITELAEALAVMHKHVAETAAQKRAKTRKALQHPGKLTLRWKGPYRVVKVVSDHLMEVQQLVPPGATSLHRTCRLRMYCEGGREVDEDLTAQIVFGDDGF
ncbi:hypothetical protein H310_06548 [Aphanomyces invadans]|uniref:Uncharacterized protein n=1 Tax=Aphanomyces invadans TaxID=157072 RepID=A0A024U6J0_9STRA|nr:hypothetical protein H310_06548 [Aphanomyces invadans]ETW02036.1 hypothetical protein H310_06548 [Aphanomyces invadans]|eukprot:XP_008869884.1 hypothetical protein H310_06548 [Aphanomyces invadans]